MWRSLVRAYGPLSVTRKLAAGIGTVFALHLLFVVVSSFAGVPFRGTMLLTVATTSVTVGTAITGAHLVFEHRLLRRRRQPQKSEARSG